MVILISNSEQSSHPWHSWLVVMVIYIDAGFIAMYATLASRDVDCCLIPESPFYLEGPGGLLEFIEKRLREQGHMVIVIAEGAGQELILSNDKSTVNKEDASNDDLFQDVGLWLSQKIKVKNLKVFPYYYYGQPVFLLFFTVKCSNIL